MSFTIRSVTRLLASAGIGALSLAAAASAGSSAQQCNDPYGDPPAALNITSGDLIGDISGILGVLLDECALVGGEALHWTDREHEPRKACLVVPPGASRKAPLPMIVFLQASVGPATIMQLLTGWVPLTRTADLNGNPHRPGFILLMPLGRDTHHYYPFLDEYALGWDNWYRNLDRNSPELNVDVATIDEFIRQVEDRHLVDTNRVYTSGWSNGAAMAQLYALNTPSIAASAVYSSPDPYADIQDPCAQVPFATTMTPLMDIHNACDVIGICRTGTLFHKNLAALYPALRQKSVIVDSRKNEVQACNAACDAQTLIGDPLGLVNHTIWPWKWNDAMFAWLRQHPLSSKH